MEPCFYIVVPLDVEHIDKFLPDFRIKDGTKYFHSPVQVARHHICRTDVTQRFAFVSEEIHPAVFEEFIDNTDSADVFAEGLTRNEATNSTDDQSDFYTTLTGFVKFF